jgi:glucose/arabinose dehydrogenase
VTERPGRVRLVQGGKLVPQPVANVTVSQQSEDGLLGIALPPGDAGTVFLYTTQDDGNRIERWTLAADHRSMRFDKVIFSGIARAQFHDGGRLRFGPDGMLYAGTGDARNPDSSQDPSSPNGKLLRLTPEGKPAPGNPTAGNPAILSGIRNTQGFDWIDKDTLVVSDHGPSGEMLRSAMDEINLVKPGANLGWPTIYGCQRRDGMVTPLITWDHALPPGGLAIYRGTSIAAWKDSVLVATLGSEHLHRVVLEGGKVKEHETYFLRQFGRLREAIMGPDGNLYLTTSNCDGRGSCPPEKDQILRVIPR